jgi:hypothetical protein
MEKKKKKKRASKTKKKRRKLKSDSTPDKVLTQKKKKKKKKKKSKVGFGQQFFRKKWPAKSGIRRARLRRSSMWYVKRVRFVFILLR